MQQVYTVTRTKIYTRWSGARKYSRCFLPQKAGVSKVRYVLKFRLAVYIALEREYPHARWSRSQEGTLILTPTSQGPVRWSSIRDPTQDLPPTRPIKVVVREGQVLYLPVGWWHYVQQIPGQTGVVIAVNYWYDQEMTGHNWVFRNFLRSLPSVV